MSGRQGKVVCITELRRACRTCSLQELCLPRGLDAEDIQRLENIVGHKGPLERGRHLFREGDPFQSIYAVRDGALKTYSIDRMAASMCWVSTSRASCSVWTRSTRG